MPQQGVNPKLKTVGIRRFSSLEVGDLAARFHHAQEIGRATPGNMRRVQPNFRV
jgi:hypothetical protein